MKVILITFWMLHGSLTSHVAGVPFSSLQACDQAGLALQTKDAKVSYICKQQ